MSLRASGRITSFAIDAENALVKSFQDHGLHGDCEINLEVSVLQSP